MSVIRSPKDSLTKAGSRWLDWWLHCFEFMLLETGTNGGSSIYMEAWVSNLWFSEEHEDQQSAMHIYSSPEAHRKYYFYSFCKQRQWQAIDTLGIYHAVCTDLRAEKKTLALDIRSICQCGYSLSPLSPVACASMLVFFSLLNSLLFWGIHLESFCIRSNTPPPPSPLSPFCCVFGSVLCIWGGCCFSGHCLFPNLKIFLNWRVFQRHKTVYNYWMNKQNRVAI